MSELTLLVLQLAFLLLLWGFVFFVIYSLRSDLFGQRARRMVAPVPAALDAGPAPAPAAVSASLIARSEPDPSL